MIAAVRDRLLTLHRRTAGFHDQLVTALLIVLSLLDVVLAVRPSLDPGYLLSVIGCLALLVRRRWPVICYLLVIPGMLLGYILIAAAVALYTLVVQRRLSWRWSLVVGIPMMLSEFIVYPFPEFLTISFPHQLARLEYAVLYTLAPVALGRTVLTGRHLAEALAESSRERQTRIEARVQQAVTDERLRIARELHDSVAHQITLVNIRSAALDVSSDDPKVREIGSDIRTLTRGTLRELRSTLTVLRSSGASARPPNRDDLAALIATCTSPVTVDGELPDALEPATARTVYRLIQESLTNAQRHAPGTRIRISFGTDGEALSLKVENSAPRAVVRSADGTGLGLIGLEERVRARHGHFTAGATMVGGWRVSATLPNR